MFRNLRAFFQLVAFWRKHPLAAGDMIGTVQRFLRWQIGTQLLGAPVVWPWVGSTRLVIERGMTGGTMNVYCGLQDFSDMTFVLHFLRSEDWFVDVGANVGSYTILASGVVGARSLCLEPIPVTFQKLQSNLALNHLGNLVQAECCAVGERPENLAFIADQDTTNRVAPEGYRGQTVNVPVRTLDELAGPFPAVMWKIDVEGFEEKLLAGAAQALRAETLRVVMIEGDNPRIREIMTGHGFRLYTYDGFRRKFTESPVLAESDNWLWLRDVEEAGRRVKDAPRHTINGNEF